MLYCNRVRIQCCEVVNFTLIKEIGANLQSDFLFCIKEIIPTLSSKVVSINI